MDLTKPQRRILAFMAKTDEGVSRNWYGPSRSGYLRHHIRNFEGRVTRTDCEALWKLKLIRHREAVQAGSFSTWYITDLGREVVKTFDAETVS